MSGQALPRRLDALLAALGEVESVQGDAAKIVSGLHDDSRRVQRGGVFFALRGAQEDGRRFIDDAVQRGAAAVVGEGLGPLDGVTVVNVRDPRAALARMAYRWHDVDARGGKRLTLLAVTGTNGKSTTTYMAAAILRAAGIRCGMFGTVQYDLCSRTTTSGMTTPGPLELAAYLRECADAGARAAVMEVSSHALDQRRTAGLDFSAAAFTNLSQDHLDYHGTMESYRDAKARLFDELGETALAVVNRDDPQHEAMIRRTRAKVTTFGIDSPAELTARVTRDSITGTVFRMKLRGADLVLENALVGRHNVYNALAAAGLALALDVEPRAIETGLTSVRNIPGRLQRIMCREGVEVFVDYAHTDDALRNVLSVLRPLTRQRLIAVFGCGGDRDRAKRPKMARAVAEFADAIIVTSDNPRTEDPRRIIDDILPGFEAGDRGRVVVEPDRRLAIRAALAGSSRGDVILIAGKGHEDYQIIGTQRHHFDDVEVALQAASELERVAQGA